ncbi:hypothetical protein [Mesorhizobium sp. KR1-2]|uniref:hypothetical protein n=1 Tax=Mesorhizobium sp. KR1-2 TaxID=3156609 RepID=UPI0032B56192
MEAFDSGFSLVMVTDYLLAVEKVQGDWKEAQKRQRAWLTPRDAATLIDEPQLATLLASLTVDGLALATREGARRLFPGGGLCLTCALPRLPDTLRALSAMTDGGSVGRPLDHLLPGLHSPSTTKLVCPLKSGPP